MQPLSQEILASISKLPGHLAREFQFRKRPRGSHGLVHVRTYRALVRLIGLCWYRSESTVLLRGQTKCFGSIRSSAARNAQLSKSPELLDEMVDRFRSSVGYDLKPKYAATTEPLLQHYGIRTRWIDLVDSVPHALFFATHAFVQSPFEKASQTDAPMTYLPSLRDRGVIYVIDMGQLTPSRTGTDAIPGVFDGDWGGAVCDLRRAKPSQALRPHMQHGWLCRPPLANDNLWDRVLLRLTFEPHEGLAWSRGAESLSRESMFPDDKWDDMYHRLRSKKVSQFFEAERARADIGAITRYDFHGGSLV